MTIPERADTGTGPARRRLTEAEAKRGALPEPFTSDEWRAMWRDCAQYQDALPFAIFHLYSTPPTP